MTRRTGISIWTGLALLLQLCTVRTAIGQSVFAPDSGKYLIRIQETEYGTDTFSTNAASGSESEIAFREGGHKALLHTSISAPDGQLRTVETTTTPGGRFRLVIEGTTARIGVGQRDQNPLAMKVVTLPKRTFPYCAIAPEQLRPILAAYNGNLGGPQSFHIFYSNSLGPGGLIQGILTLTMLGLTRQTVNGVPTAVLRYSALIPSPRGDMNAEITVDQAMRVLMFRIPAEGLLVIRDGYREADLRSETSDLSVAAPSFELKVERNVRVPMRDGISLAADVYRPDALGRFPVILQRTCQGRRAISEGPFFARRGYVYVAQDVRGRFNSEGDWLPWVNEARDGSDTIGWCAAQRWSNGNVGMIGEAYSGFAQWAAARERNPHLKCMTPIAAMPGSFFGPAGAEGAFRLLDAMTWAGAVAGKSGQPADVIQGLEGFRALPVTEVDAAVFGRHVELVQEWLRAAGSESVRKQSASGDSASSLPNIPILQIVGWFDPNSASAFGKFQAMAASRFKNQKLVCGPWTQVVNSSTRIDRLDFGLASIRNIDVLALHWFDRWLKDVKNDADREPPIDAFITGANQWRSFTAWPPREAKQTRWYLHSDGNANSDRTGGRLSLEKPSIDEPPDHYDYQPLQPFVPLSTRAGQFGNLAGTDLVPQIGQPDVLAYTSYALESDVIVAGPIEMRVYAASTAPDTDWFGALLDVAPDGSSSLLVYGMAHPAVHNAAPGPESSKNGAGNSLRIQLESIGHSFKKGHHLQIVLTSSFFPIYARNLNTAKDRLTTAVTSAAHQTINHTLDRPSYIVLPTLPR